MVCPDCHEDLPIREFSDGVHKDCPAAGPRLIRDETVRCPNCDELSMVKTPRGHKCPDCGYLEVR